MNQTVTLDNRLKTGFGIAIFFVLMVGVIAFLTFNQQDKQAQHVNHIYTIINEVTFMESILIDMETGRRGFRSTNDRKFLQPYYAGLTQLPMSFSRLRTLAKENNSLLQNIRKLEVEVDSVLVFWSLLGIDASKYTFADVTRMMNQEKEKMDIVREKVRLIMAEQKHELELKEAETRRIVQRAMIELVLGIIFILMLVLALIYQIVKEFRIRRKAETELQQRNQDLLLINEESSSQNWLLSGVAEIGNSLHGQNEVVNLSKAFLRGIMEYLEATAGAVYLYDSENNTLHLTAGYALPADARKVYQLHDGLVGQAAVADKPIIVKELLPEHLTIESATVMAKPAEALYLPIYLDEQLKCVLELLHLGSFEEKEMKLLQVIGGNFAVTLHSAQATQKSMELLDQVQKQKEILENQQEELRQINEELTQQADVLQASEEELRVQEEELRQINAELEEKNEVIEMARHSLTQKAKELENTSRYKSDFLANMSHELRTPLNSILILARLLADNNQGNLTEKQVAHARIIHKSGSDLLQLINDILDLSKIEAGKMEVHPEEVKVQTICSNMHQLFSMVADEKQIHFETKIDPGVPETVITDKQKLEQVLINLLSNAFKFTNSSGAVKLSISNTEQASKPCMVFEVADTGIGIPPEKQKLIFEAFSQADSSTSRKYGGTGLGLSIITNLVQLLGGTISLHSKQNEGSTFTVNIPIHHGDALQPQMPNNNNEQGNEDETEEASTDEATNEQPEGNNTMLIIEDDAVLASVVCNYAKSKNYQPIVAETGEEGLAEAKKHLPSVIILDMKLPGMDGAAVLRQLKNDPDLQQIPVHVMSSAVDLKGTPGAISFLQKPFNLDELERAFSVIGSTRKDAVRKVLFISQNDESLAQLQKMVSQSGKQVSFDTAEDVKQAAEMHKSKRYHLVIADISKDLQGGIAQLKWLQQQSSPLPVPTIIVIDEDISQASELDVKKVANVVVRKSLQSHKRLMDELELFLYKVKEEKQSNQLPDVAPSIDQDLLHGKKVLLVDDDMRNVFAMSAALEHENMEVVVAGDGKEAVDILANMDDIDIVLMDIMMPEMDGYEATRYIRQQLNLQKLPVIALTAKAMSNDREKCIEAGASDYITKPVDIHKLISLMRVWLA